MKKKSPFFHSLRRVAAPEAIRKSNNRIIFFFAKTIKTVVAGSFVPQEKESPRFFTLEEFLFFSPNVVSLVNSFFFFFPERRHFFLYVTHNLW